MKITCVNEKTVWLLCWLCLFWVSRSQNMQSCYSSVLLINAYSCDHKFKHNHYGYECYGNFRAFTDFFELFFLQGGLIIQQTSLMTSRKQEFGATIWNSIWCSPIHTESNVNTPHNKIKCPSCGQIFSQNCSTSLVKVTKASGQVTVFYWECIYTLSLCGLEKIKLVHLIFIF